MNDSIDIKRVGLKSNKASKALSIWSVPENFLCHSQQMIWMPQLIFDNTDSQEETSLDEKVFTLIFPNEKFAYEKADMAENNNGYIFDGNTSKIRQQSLCSIKSNV